jgi:hypothetical protein
MQYSGTMGNTAVESGLMGCDAVSWGGAERRVFSDVSKHLCVFILKAEAVVDQLA